MKIKIAPSILSADFASLGNEVKRLEASGADMIHIDVMDGHFVPNITIGAPVVKALRKHTTLPLDVHLMITNPENYINDFAEAGADIICVHAEVTSHLNRLIQMISEKKIIPAVSINPATPLSMIEWVLKDIGMVLLMSVNPGFGGQSYIESVTDKIKDLRNMIEKKDLQLDIEVDGGISIDNIGKVTEAGANVIVSGSAIFNADNMTDYIARLKAPNM
jgi:ribulose-phosphate 3-epimerase